MMKETKRLYSAFACPNDRKAMNALLMPIANREELLRIIRTRRSGQAIGYDKSSNTMRCVLYSQEIVACLSVTPVPLKEAAEIGVLCEEIIFWNSPIEQFRRVVQKVVGGTFSLVN